jgi:hypothetical protein
MFYQGFQQKLDEIKTGLIQRNLSGILLYPNPVFNKFTLNFPGFNSDKVNCIISDLNGRIILSKSLNNISTEFDISFLSPGLYILKIYSENSNFNFTQKIIKK